MIPSVSQVLQDNPLITTLHPAIQPFCVHHVVRSYVRGVPSKVVQAKRSRQEQFDLWCRGRDPQTGMVIDQSKVVTKLKVGWHNFGLAYDLGLLKTTTSGVSVVSFDSNVDRNADGIDDWKELADIGVELGMDAGYYWTEFVDEDHFERHRGLTLAEAISRDDRGLDVVTGLPLSS